MTHEEFQKAKQIEMEMDDLNFRIEIIEDKHIQIKNILDLISAPKEKKDGVISAINSFFNERIKNLYDEIDELQIKFEKL